MYKNSKKISCLISSILCLGVSLTCNNKYYVSSQINIHQKNQFKQQKEELRKKLNKELILMQNNKNKEYRNQEELDTKIKEVENKIDESNKYINNLENEILELKENIFEIEKDIEEKTELLKEALVSIYKAGDASTLEIVLGSKDFDDFLDKKNVVKSVGDAVKEIIDSLNEKSLELENQKNNVEKKKLEQEIEKQNLENSKIELQALVLESKKLLEEYEQSENATKQEINENDAEINKINAEIEQYYQEQRRLEEERRKREEEARKKAKTTAPSKKTVVLATSTQKVVNNGKFVWPVPGFSRISSGFNDTINRRSVHGAIDIASSPNKPIYGATIVSSGDGVVIAAGPCGGFGNLVVVDHGNSTSTWYGHMSCISVKYNQKVSKGQAIGNVGNTGFSTGPHLHFEMRFNGQKQNPLNYVHC